MSSHISDPRLIPRIREFLQSKKLGTCTSVVYLAEELQRKYSEYGRRKKNVFVKLVGKAYGCVLQEEKDRNQRNPIDDLETKYLKKRQKKNDTEAIDSDSDSASFSSDNNSYVQYEDKNSINNMMTNMYKKTSTPNRTADHNQKPSNKLFLIDRTGERPSPLQTTFNNSIKNADVLLENLEEKSDSKSDIVVIGDDDLCDDSVDLAQETDRQSRPGSVVSVDLAQESDRQSRTGSIINESVGNKRSLKKSSATPKKKRKRQDNEEKEKEKKGPEVQKSTVTFADIGGNDDKLVEICKLLVHMRHPEVYQQLGVTPPRGFLLHGPPGCGKTLLAHAIAGELSLSFIKIAATEIVSGVSGESEEKVRDLFDSAVAAAPCVLFIDEIDAITPKRETASKDMERRIVAQLLSCMDDLSSKTDLHVLVIGATNRPDSLDPALRRAGRFDKEICLGIPDESSRERILRVLCRNLKLAENFDYKFLARNTPGYVGADLTSLTREAAMVAVNRVFSDLQKSLVTNPIEQKTDSANSVVSDISTDQTGGDIINSTGNGQSASDQSVPDTTEDMETETSSICIEEKPKDVNFKSLTLIDALSWLKEFPPLTNEQLQTLNINLQDFEATLKHVQPSAKREGFATIPDVTWDDIGALHAVREDLQLAILAPVRHPEAFKDLGLSKAQGILLAGPPGCGKTLLAKAVANESGINFISVKGPELLNMYVGESERAVRQVFQRARNSSPCVIFFDELDALCPRRSDSGEGGSSVRVVNQLLTEMDGLEERKSVFIMGATNRPDIIDPAILRPGRLDKTLYVGLPCPDDRLDILKTITKNGTKPKLSLDVDLESLAKDERCNCFTGADLAALVREASMSALKVMISSQGTSIIEVNKEHFNTAFTRVRPSVSQKEQLKYAKLKEQLQNG
ncbi:ribosome biogenesis ATPase [Mytilus galloprovincialis]|uniref:Ribosome biogenesis ATPase n=1 Tax=Mytilus galloprovincialis TaxID=29158 RepID=A0A8B6BZM0_MYTGA|nr:ribosome biogenesis ATPase [Mytilus galloprovincialis]